MAAYPELQHLTVDVYHWLTADELLHFYSLGQLCPGPNMMMVTAVGEKVAGPLGALVVVVAFFLPTALLTFAVGRMWKRFEGAPWRDSIQAGLAPVSIGLLLAGSLSIAKVALTDWVAGGLAAAVFALLVKTKINPAFLIVGGALVGYFSAK